MTDVSIIVPIYNVEKYLRACFTSLLKQDYDNYIIVAVDDGSPDNSAKIIDEFATQYPDKIKAIHKDNGGYGSVLQLAIKEMETPYFIICDPDDTLEPNALSTLVSLAKLSGTDITVGAKMVMKEGTTLKEYDASYNKDYVQLKTNTIYRQSTPEFDDLFFINPSPHAKLYRTSICKNIKFLEKTGYTDNILFYMALLNSQKVIYTDKPLANYLIDRTGNTMTDVSFKALIGQIDVFSSILKQAETVKNVPDIFYYRMFEAFKYILYQSRNLNCSKEQYIDALSYLKSLIKLLASHKKEIKPYYKKYTKNGFREKRRDLALLNPLKMDAAYKLMTLKMVREFSH